MLHYYVVYWPLSYWCWKETLNMYLHFLSFLDAKELEILPYGAHDDVIKWKHFSRYWPFERGIHRSPVNSSHKGQWCGALMFPLICAWINGWVNNGEAGDLRRHRTHYDVIVKGRTHCDATATGIWITAAISMSRYGRIANMYFVSTQND